MLTETHISFFVIFCNVTLLAICGGAIYQLVIQTRKGLLDLGARQTLLNDSQADLRNRLASAQLSYETAEVQSLVQTLLSEDDAFVSSGKVREILRAADPTSLDGPDEKATAQVAVADTGTRPSFGDKSALLLREQSIAISSELNGRLADLRRTYRAELNAYVTAAQRYLALRPTVRESGLRKLKALLGWEGRGNFVIVAARRHDDLLVMLLPAGSRLLNYVHSLAPRHIEQLIRGGKVNRIVLYRCAAEEKIASFIPFALPQRIPKVLFAALARHLRSATRRGEEPRALDTDEYFEILSWAKTYPGFVDVLAPYVAHRLRADSEAPPALERVIPFDEPDNLPPTLPAAPRRNSVLFLHNNYYHFKYLSKALRDRGWDALAVAMDSPESHWRQFIHGEDLSLYDPDPTIRRQKIRSFLATIPERFGTVHFYGRNAWSFFTENWEDSTSPQLAPWDLLELRRHNTLIGYMPSGCLDGGSQSSIRQIADNLCSKCVWETQPNVCSDARNLSWARKISSICDFVTLEGDLTVDDRVSPIHVRRPVATALDPDFWDPNLEIPEEHRIPRDDHELIIYHAVGLSKLRRKDDRDIKGTGAVMAAVEQLQKEGLPVRLFFTDSLHSMDVRYYQLQADIVIDQLNYGRFGATAREALMLGRPLITCLRPQQAAPLPPLKLIEEAPALHATEETIYETLKQLALDPERREAMGKASRAFALQWHAAPVCALRYERMIDRVRSGLPPEADEVFAI